eukprot:gene6523-8964_t
MGIVTANYFDNFTTYSLANQDYIISSVIFSLILSLICLAGQSVFPKDPKKLCWVVSSVNSFCCTVIGIVYLYVKAPKYKDFFFYGPEGLLIFHNLDNISALVCLWFTLANIFDIGFGLIYYPKYIQLLTGYIHHSVYIWLMHTAVTGNGIFLLAKPFAPAFAFMLIEEMPTFFLGLGSMFPNLRTDIGFGSTFFLFRILFHGYMLTYSVFSKAQTVIIVMYTLTLLLHVHWFSTWITKYGVKFLKKGNTSSVNKKID